VSDLIENDELEEPEAPQLGETVVHTTDEEGGLPSSNGAGSLLDALVAQRDELATHRDTFLPVPGYESSGFTLYAHYRLLDGEEIAKIGSRVQREFSRKQVYERNLYAAIDVMISSCQGFWAETPEGERIQLTNGDMPILGYGLDLAQAMKFEDEIEPSQPARSVVLALFVNNIVAIQTHSIMLGRWMGDTSTDVTTNFLEGEGNP